MAVAVQASTGIPDFLVRLHPAADGVVRNLIVEVSGGRKDQDKRAVKAHTARYSWCVAVNNHGGYGRWAFIEVADPWDAQNLIRGFLKQAQAEATKEVAHG